MRINNAVNRSPLLKRLIKIVALVAMVPPTVHAEVSALPASVQSVMNLRELPYDTLSIYAEDLESGEKQTLHVKAGTRLRISPGVAHAYRSRGYCQVLEWSPEPYDPGDTYPHKVVI